MSKSATNVLQIPRDRDSTADAGDESRRGPATPIERVFAHWVYMLGRHPGRVALGPKRRAVIERALGLYDEETLLLAVDGCAASRWHAGENDRGRAFNDLELILRDEAHVERFAEDGERLRQRAERELRRREAEARALASGEVVELDVAGAAAAREKLRELQRELAARMAGRALR